MHLGAIAAAALTRLAGQRSDGTDATTEARVSDGPPRRIHIITYDTPQHSHASGATDSFGCR